MNVTKKILLAGLLTFGMIFTSGCDDVNYETKFESTSSVSVDSSTYKETVSESNGPLVFKINDVNLKKGETEFRISITNTEKKDTTMTEMTISFKATDENKTVLREGTSTFNNLSVALPAGKEIYETFTVEDANAAAYDKSFNIQYEITNIKMNPNPAS